MGYAGGRLRQQLCKLLVIALYLDFGADWLGFVNAWHQ